MTTEAQTQTKVLECVLCTVRYSIDDIEAGEYQLKTKVCSSCYARLQKLPHNISCFGKPNFALFNGTILKGYDENTDECSKFCPDRHVCRRTIYG